MKIEVDLVLPMQPNYLKTVTGQTVDVSDLNDEQLQEIGKQWTVQLIQHARDRRDKPE